MKLGHSSLISMMNFLSKSALFVFQEELNFIMFSKFWSYFKEHLDSGFLGSSSQAAWKWMRNSEIILVPISEQLLLQLWLFPYIFLAHAKFVFFFKWKAFIASPNSLTTSPVLSTTSKTTLILFGILLHAVFLLSYPGSGQILKTLLLNIFL